MPLSTPSERQLAHTRIVTCQGYERADGLWDIEAHIVDTKPFSFPNKDRGGRIEADEPLHGMSIRVTIDLDMLIHAAEQCTDFSPYHYCKNVEHFSKNLIGQRIGPGWTQKTKEWMGGSQGCTHLTELLGPLATTAYQTLVKARYKDITATAEPKQASANSKPPRFIGSCHALQLDSPVLRDHWPQFYQPDSASKPAGTEPG
ncbi:MAG: DUF2889 domain-containing protein [Thiolinea sp.]